MVAGVAFASSASAVTTVDNAISKAFQTSETTIIFEDNDRFQFTDIGPLGPSIGDVITGMIHFQAIDRDGLVPPNTIRTTTQAPQNGSGRTILGDGSGSTSGFAGIFTGRIIGLDGAGAAFLGPLAGSAPGLVWTFADGTTYVQAGPAGSMVELYEDNASLAGTVYDDSSPATAVVTGLDGAFYASVGMTMAPVVGMNAADEAFQNFDFNGDGFADLFEIDLNILSSSSGIFAAALPNDIGGPDLVSGYPYGIPFSFGMGSQLHGAGTFAPPPIGNPWTAFSDGNFAILTIPTPSAALVGLIAFGSLGLRRRTHGGLLRRRGVRRRRTIRDPRPGGRGRPASCRASVSTPGLLERIYHEACCSVK